MPNSSNQQPLPFLHELSDFAQLLEATAQSYGLPAEQVEKDYWLMHVLSELTHKGFSFQLKGGTSLAKGYHIIERFSEDIDIRIEPEPSMIVPFGKNQNSTKQRKLREEFFSTLATKISITGIQQVERDPAFDDQTNFRNAGIRLIYPTVYSTPIKLKIGILLEVGFDDTYPNKPCDISSWALEQALKSDLKLGVDILDNRALGILCYCPEYTFVEKLQTVSTKYRQERTTGKMPANFLRHYYDIYALLACPEVQAFIGTDAYHTHKDKRFRTQDEKTIAKNEAFVLSDPQIFNLYEQEYQTISEFFYSTPPSFREILSRIQTYIKRL